MVVVTISIMSVNMYLTSVLKAFDGSRDLKGANKKKKIDY